MDQLAESRCYPEALESEVADSGSVLGVTRGKYLWLPLAEWCLLVVFAFVFVLYSFLPGWTSLRSEFPNYYLAAELYHLGIPLDRVYEWTWFQRQNDHLGVRQGLVSFAPNPPSLIFTMLPLSRLQPLAAKRVWMSLSLIFLALSIWLLHKVMSLGWRRLVLITLMCVLPLNMDFRVARHYVFILFLICAAYYFACRQRHWASGTMWSVAAAIKLFPAFAVILLIRKRAWRALSGFAVGLGALTILSISVFGAEVHRVFVREVLSQAPRGDWLGPYLLSQNSFTTLWSHLFLIEPEQNPFPWINSPALYAVSMAITVTILLFVFLRSVEGYARNVAVALEWSALVPLLLLLSTNTAPDYACLLIFSAIVGFDALLANGNKKMAVALLFLYAIACGPMPTWILRWFPIYKLAATVSIYGLLLYLGWKDRRRISATTWKLAGVFAAVALTFYNLHIVSNRAEDFDKRVVTTRNQYSFRNPVPAMNQMAAVEMQWSKYTPALLTTDGVVEEIPVSGDVLSVAGSGNTSSLYLEMAGRESVLTRVAQKGSGGALETLTDGQEPALSANGKWLVFLREERGRGSVWLLPTDFIGAVQPVLTSANQPLDVTVTNDGDVIAAAGNVSDPSLLMVPHGTGKVSLLSEFGHPVRYPSISPDGRRLAFSRRDRGFWHLVVHSLETGIEKQLTDASCNATSPSWQDNQTVLYATDCGRGIGMGAIARVILAD